MVALREQRGHRFQGNTLTRPTPLQLGFTLRGSQMLLGAVIGDTVRTGLGEGPSA